MGLHFCPTDHVPPRPAILLQSATVMKIPSPAHAAGPYLSRMKRIDSLPV